MKPVFSQDVLDGSKVWYSSYLYHKLNKKIYIDDYLLVSFNALQHSFSFLQNDLSINYELSKKSAIYFTYSRAMYNWTPAYKDLYVQPITSFNTIDFNRLAIGGKYDIKFKKYWKLDQDLSAQFYFPQLEKYQSRFTYDVKIAFKSKKMPLQLSPFITESIFYYQNGIPTFYYNEDGSLGDYKSPNGFHRIRTKFGLSFHPVKTIKKLGVIVYYSMQKEFNIPGLGNDLNISSPGNSGDVQKVTLPQRVIYPFNDYNVFGIQLNLFL